MYTLGIVMIIDKLFRSILFLIDDAVYNIIPTLYDLIISIARTSPLSQANIADMASRIYRLLAVFMVFKITFSLIMYVVNPDDFSDKSKGVSKLITNVVISLALLVLTPYIFNYAFQLQRIILEDNSLATVVFGEEVSNTDNSINTVGDKMAYIAISPFVTPNTNYFDCSRLFIATGANETVMLNPSCFGFEHVSDYIAESSTCMHATGDGKMKTLCQVAEENEANSSKYLTKEDVQNYAAGVEYGSFNLLFRKRAVLSYMDITTEDEDSEVFAFSYKFLISTVAGIVIALFLITTCMDVGLRSIKLAFLQLIAPIPILSYIDPKSGKDGMFKKWYQMSIKTFLGLFVYLLAFYFAVYIISMVSSGNLYDVIDGSYVTTGLVKIFITIGALMFVKALPKILEGLGIKLEGGFTLNPIKKFEEQALGGKRILGAASGLTVGALGGVSLAARDLRHGKLLSAVGDLGIESLKGGIGGGIKGEGFTKGWKSQVAANRRMREAVANGSTFWGRRYEDLANLTGMVIPATSESLEASIHQKDEQIKENQNKVKSIELERDSEKAKLKEYQRKREVSTKSVNNLKDVLNAKMEEGVGVTGRNYKSNLATLEALKGQIGQTATWTEYDLAGTATTYTAVVDTNAVTNLSRTINDFKNDGYMELYNEAKGNRGLNGKITTAIDEARKDFKTVYGDAYETLDEDGKVTGTMSFDDVFDTGTNLNKFIGASNGDIRRVSAEQRRIDESYYNEIKKYNDKNELLEEQKRVLYEQQRAATANKNAEGGK